MHEQSRVRDAFNLNSRHRRVYRSGRRVLYRDPHSNSAAFMIRPGGLLKKFAKDTWPVQRLELTNLRCWVDFLSGRDYSEVCLVSRMKASFTG